MKRFTFFLVFFLVFLALIIVNFFLKITIDYDLISKTEKRITPAEYYLFYLKNHYVRNEIKVNNVGDSVYVLEFKEDDKLRRIKYRKNKFGSLIKYLRYNSNEEYELSSFDRIVIYNKNYVIFLEKPIISDTFINAQVFKKSVNNTFKCFHVSFKKPIQIDKIKSINFDEFKDFQIDGNTLLVFDIEKNIFYGINEDFDFKQSYKIEDENQKELNNAQSICSPFFEPMGGKDFFNLIHGFN